MSKRNAKSKIQYAIGDAIEELVAHGGMDDKNFEAKAEQLFILHDTAIAKINAVNKVEGRSARKLHFKELFKDFSESVEKVLNSK